MTETVGEPVVEWTEWKLTDPDYTSPPIVECACTCGCPELAEADQPLCIACKHQACPDDSE